MTTDQFHSYMSLFHSRSDVYARYWQKASASGYSPAYTFNWQAFNAHRVRGGSLKDFDGKKTSPLTKGVFLQHVRGELAAGVFPILQDNTCYFLAADFDGKQWLADCKRYITACRDTGLTAYLERSKSGKGGHVWLFFEKAYPCFKARQIGLGLIRQSEAGHAPAFAKQQSFDRLFPNQDSLPSGGYGNLIALPLQGQAVARGNTVFIDLATDEPYPDQWGFIDQIKRHTQAELDNALHVLATTDISTYAIALNAPTPQGPLLIKVSSHISLSRQQVSPFVGAFLRERLNFLSAEYLTKKRLGKPVYDVQKHFQLIEENATEVLLPRGFLGQLIDFLRRSQLPFTVRYCHAMQRDDLSFQSLITLTKEQERIVDISLRCRQGIIVAPPGSGKTIMAMELIAARQKPALVLVHRRQLLDQWVERIQTHLAIPKSEIGIYSGADKKIGAHITVGSLQTFARVSDWEELTDAFGTIIIDECHHVPAKTFRAAIARLNPEFLYGLTATPKRKHGDERLLYAHIGEIIATMKAEAQPAKHPFEVNIHKTNLKLPFQWQTDQFELLAKVVCFDTARNRLVLSDILEQVALGRKVLVLSERKEHLGILDLYLKGQCETLQITGDDLPALRTSKLHRAKTGDYQVLLSTGQLFGEGLDIDTIESLILAFPFSFEGKLIQYTGRLAHSLKPRALIDYHDSDIAFLDRQFKHRQRYYRKLLAANPPQVHPLNAPLTGSITPFSVANSSADL